MNRELAIKVADAVLYEGYMLYPYRRSAIKNRQRWSFGILYPPDYAEVRAGTERSSMHSECLLETRGSAALQIQLRFLHLVSKRVFQSVEDGGIPAETVRSDDHLAENCDEGVERSVEFELSQIAGQHRLDFDFPEAVTTEPMRDETGCSVGITVRLQNELKGSVSISTEKISHSALKLILDVENTTPCAFDTSDRDSALLRSLLSAHVILALTGGEFVSLLDPPTHIQGAVRECRNVGNFPVLVGSQGERDMLLCSPILLYDYPQVAPESAGDFYDATEMDEMLTLRLMTLTDQEKDEMRLTDGRTRNLLQRTEQTAREQLMRTHGIIRGFRAVNE
jgi:hydrogenase maturation protease